MVRRIAEIFAVSVMINAVTVVPILVGLMFGQSSLYIWNDATLSATDELIRNKVPYLNAPFFVVRTIGYFAVWIYLARRLWLESSRQDLSGVSELSLRMEKLSAPTLLLCALTVTFAAIDWVLSLDPHWFSSIFGIYFFSGSMVAFLAALTLTVDLLEHGVHGLQVGVVQEPDLGVFLILLKGDCVCGGGGREGA